MIASDPVAATRSRLSGFLLAQLQRWAALEAIDQAAAHGVVERVEHASGLAVFRCGKAIAGWTLARVRALLGRSSGLHRHAGAARQDSDSDSIMRGRRRTIRRRQSAGRHRPGGSARWQRERALLRMARAHTPPPVATEVAAQLMIADAVALGP